MRRWIPQSVAKLRRTDSPDRKRPGIEGALELLVIEGPDAGSRFTLDTGSVGLGRGEARTGRSHRVCLRDPGVAPDQAEIRLGDEATLEHRPEAASPTLLNGRPIERARLRVGDRIGMGASVLEVRARHGKTLSGLIAASGTLPAAAAPPGAAATTEIRAVDANLAELRVLQGVPGLEGRTFGIGAGGARLGRHPENDVVLDEPGVSRSHAELVWEGDRLVLLHRSATNATRVGGRLVEDRIALRDGEEIELAERVRLSVSIPGDPGASLREHLEEKLQRDAEIERRFGFRGTFLDVDVVDSHGLKTRAERLEHIIVSFERFRAFAGDVVEEHSGEVLNSNGDELMCFFDEALHAVRAAAAIAARLPGFNAEKSLLSDPFQVRQGIHTGESLLDRVRRVSYSPVLDVAGHLQKLAPAGGILLSADTRAELPEDLDGLSLAPCGEVGRAKIAAYRLEAAP